MVIFVLNLGFMVSCIVYGLFINECSNVVYTIVCILQIGFEGRGVVQGVRLLLSIQLSYRRSTTAACTTTTLCVSIVLVAVLLILPQYVCICSAVFAIATTVVVE